MTLELQKETEEAVFAILRPHLSAEHDSGGNKGLRPSIKLHRARHISYLRSGLVGLRRGFVSLDASKPWIIYWILHSLDLLGEVLNDDEKTRAIETLSKCQNTLGGYGGGPAQLPHLATTYAAVSALAIIGTPAAYNSINREAMLAWMLRLKQADGSFRMHDGGEVDVRGSYCALSVARLLNMLTPELVENTGQFIQRCQTYEGGLGSTPFVEAHGGYTFCGFAAAFVINQEKLLNIDSLTHPGRCKLRAAFRVVRINLSMAVTRFGRVDQFLYSNLCCGRKLPSDALQRYILVCCQNDKNGGLLDKPGKPPDFYHTCYCLSGLAIAQYQYVLESNRDFSATLDEESVARSGGSENIVFPTHPIHNLRLPRVQSIVNHFQKYSLNGKFEDLND